MKKIIITIIIIFLILVSIIAYYLRPIKFAVKEKELASRNGYILVKVQKVTGFFWMAVGDETGMFDENRDVRISGTLPGRGFNIDVEAGDNIYICYGKYIGEGDFYGSKYKEFEAYDWDILYPVNRNLPFDFILPKGYLCYLDKD